MDSQTVRTALGLLQDDPEHQEAWQSLRNSLKDPDGDLGRDELTRLFSAARAKHRERGEWEAVAALLEVELDGQNGTAQEPELLSELAKVLQEELLDDAGATAAYEKRAQLVPGDELATQALEEGEAKRSKWKEIRDTYQSEAEQAPDDVYKSSMLMRAAEIELRYAGEATDLNGAIERLEQAVRLDPTNEHAGRMLERIYRKSQRWEEAARVLERLADRSDTPSGRAEAGVRLARLYSRKLSDPERAASAYERVLRNVPDHAESMSVLTDLYSREERWTDLVTLFERELKSKDLNSPERLGDMLQIAMLHWRKLERPADAEPWFDRIRKIEPAHPGMLDFFREYAAALDDDKRLIEVLTAAQRATKDAAEKGKLGSELARLSEGQANAQAAIEQYKSVLRTDPDNAEARSALKRLYKQTQSYNALVELLRQELDRVPSNGDEAEYQARIAILREVAAVYRQYIKSESALVSVLNQIVQLDEKLDEHDVEEMRELVALYEKLGRWRDLLTHQLKLAEITPDLDEKKLLYRSAARRWLEQFSNVQNATDAYAALLAIEPTDHEARERLEELYRKRRAWAPLFELYEGELPSAEGAERVAILKEMATLAAERLNRGSDAVRLYKQILEMDSTRVDVLDALEKYAERSKDWQTLSEVLERRVDAAADETTRLAVLQKLGAVYAEHLKDHQASAKAWRRVLELSPGHHRALRVLRDTYLLSGDYDGLHDLYGSQNDWEGLAEVFSNGADRAGDPAVKIELSYRAAGVYEGELAQPDRAFRSYERVLSTDPNDTRAAQALIPLYEADEKWARLPALYEILLSQTQDADQQYALINKLVDVTGQRLSDRKAAVAYAARAYQLRPGDLDALDAFESAARAASNWEPFVSALEAQLGAGAPAAGPASGGKKKKKKGGEDPAPATGAPHARLLELKLARVYATELGRVDDAVATYKNHLTHEPSDEAAAAELDAILRRDDRRDELRWLFGLRVDNASSDGQRVQLLSEWAQLEEDVYESPQRAVELFRRLLEVEPGDDAALRALPRLLLEQGDAQGAVEVIERDRDRLSGELRADREVELAEHYLAKLSRPRDALDAAVRALEIREQDPRAMSVLEQLVSHEEVRARAAEVLATEYSTSGEARREAQSLSVMLEATQDSEERISLYSRLADVHEQKLGAFGTALDVLLRAVREFPARLELWDRADSLAVQAGRPTDLAEAFREVLRAELPREQEIELCELAARLHEDRLGDPLGATPYLEKVLAADPSNEQAFARLKDILTGADRWSELEALYDRASAATEDPARKVEMLVEVALISEEIIEDAKKATRYYERILEIDPQHEGAILALDRLYARAERHEDLAVLLERRLETADGDEICELKLRLSRLQLEKLHQPERAVHHVEDVLRERPNDYEARELAEKLLSIGSLRGRAAEMLEVVYEARDEIRDLVRVLSIRLEEADASAGGSNELDDVRKDLLRRISTLRDERLHDDEGALDALARLVPNDPLDLDARERLLEIGRRVSAHERMAEVLIKAADATQAVELKGEILMQVAGIYEDMLSDTERAEQCYRRVLSLDENDAALVLPAARALERIYVAREQHKELAGALKTQVRLESDGDKRKDLLGRLGELCQSVLDDTEGAIEAWRTRSDENPDDGVALAALDRLYEQTERYRNLVEVLERRRDLIEDAGRKRELMVRIAVVLADKLASIPEAIDGWRAVLEEFGPDEPTLEALQALYQTAERWDELGEAYERHLDIADSEQLRLDLLAKLGDLRREHLSDVEGALEVYKNALTIDTGHQPSRSALEKLLDAEDTATKSEAAAILHPIYEADADYERLLRVLSIEIETAEDPLGKLEGLEAALRVAEDELKDPSRAFGYAERAVREAVGHAELGPWLEHLERLASATQRQADYVKLLSQIVPDIFDGDVQLTVVLKIADLARHQLADRELAQEYYKKALELRADDRAALAALESLYEEAGDAVNLLEVLERRAETAEDDAEKKQLLFRRARLLAEVLEDRPRAIDVYENILELELDRGALDALEGLYSDEERWNDLVDLYQRELDADLDDAAKLRVKIAQVAGTKLKDLARAFDELEQALDMERQHEGAISELERLLTEAAEPEHRARAAELLEPVYLLRADYGRVMGTIRARLDFAEDPEQRRDLLTRLAQLYEEQKEDYLAALETIAKLLHEDIADESTVGELERLAKVAGAEKRLAEIYADELEDAVGEDPNTARLARRAGELFTELGELARGLTYYRRALAFEPESVELFNAVDGILRRTDKHEERVELYRQALDHRFEPAERLAALHTIAGLLRNELGQPDAAIDTYRSALEVDDTDARALDALTELYRSRERWDDLAELYLMRAESAETADAGAEYRLALARLYKQELAQTDRCIDQLDEIVRSVPTFEQAIKELEALLDVEEHKERVIEILRPLYESADDWRHMIKLNEDRYALATEPADKVVVLRETAELWESRGSDRERARRALRVAFGLDPDDPDVRSEYERLVEGTSAWNELAQSYEKALEDNPDLASKRDVLAKLAEVHDEQRDDPRSALGAYARLHEVEPSELLPLNKMEQLATLLSDWPVVVQALTAKADLLLDDEERASVWRRVGEAKRDMLEDSDGAIEAYERALELEDDSAFTVDCLTALYEEKRDAQRLVELYQRRYELCDEDDAELRYELSLSSAKVFETEIKEPLRAIEMLNQALADKAGDPEVLAGLNRLYRAEEMWPELLDNLRLQASAAEGVDERAELRRQIGGILSEKLGSHEEALDAYRMVLDEVPGDSPTIIAVRRIGHEHEDLREPVAGILVPVLRDGGRHDELTEVLEMRLTVETDPPQRAETLRTIAAVLEEKLSKPDEAEGALLRALAETPESAELHGEIERLAAACEGWGRYAEALGERAQSTFDPDLAKDLLTRLGRVAEERLKDDRRAVEAYQRAVEQAGDQPELLEPLDRLYLRLDDSQALSEILERRVVIEPEESAQAELYNRLALIQLEKFEEPARALGSLKMALERAPDHQAAAATLERLTSQRDLFEEAAEVLETVYRTQNQTAKLAELYEKRVGFADAPGERIDMRRNLARVLEEDCGDAKAAQTVLEQGLFDDPADAALLDEIERLAPITEGWASAATALYDAVEKKSDLVPDVARDMLVRAATWLRDKSNDPEGAERALLKALEHEPNSDEVLVLVEELQRAPGRERDLIATLRRRGKLALDDEKREDLYRQAKSLADTAEDRDLSESVLRELLGHDDTNLWALGELTEVRQAQGDYQETFDLLVRRSELRAQAEVVRELRHRAALIARTHLNDNAKAIELYSTLFDDEPTDRDAQNALTELYQATERWDDLGRHLERLVDLADSGSERADLRIRLARLNEEQFNAPDTAIELLRAVLDDEPGHSETVVQLSELYEKTGRDEELADLLNSQLDAARERGDQDAELTFQVRLGEVYESRLNDRAKAIETYRSVLERDADHRDALTALARLYRADEKNTEAAEILTRLLSLSEGADAIQLAMELADVFGKLGQTQDAARALEQGLKADERHDELRARLKQLYEVMEAWEELANHIAKDAEFSDNVDQKVELLRKAAGIHTVKRSDHARAAELLDTASGLKADDRALMLELCDAYSASGRGKAAAEVLEKIVESYGGKRSKELGEIHRRLANAYLAEGEKEKALEELDKAFRIEPGNINVLLKLGQVALEMEDLKKAQQMFRALLLQKLEEGGPISKAEVFMNLGEVHKRLGEKSKAIQMLERAVQADDSLEAAKQKLAELKG